MTTHRFTLGMTTWHITWGTYSTRLHGDDQPTVDKQHNQRHEPFIAPDAQRQDEMRKRMTHNPVYLSEAQRQIVENALPRLCEDGGCANVQRAPIMCMCCWM